MGTQDYFYTAVRLRTTEKYTAISTNTLCFSYMRTSATLGGIITSVTTQMWRM